MFIPQLILNVGFTDRSSSPDKAQEPILSSLSTFILFCFIVNLSKYIKYQLVNFTKPLRQLNFLTQQNFYSLLKLASIQISMCIKMHQMKDGTTIASYFIYQFTYILSIELTIWERNLFPEDPSTSQFFPHCTKRC